jgi:hypothetical protein
MRVARNFPGRRRASASRHNENQHRRLQFQQRPVVSRLEFSLVKNLNLTIPPFLALLATISTIRPMHCLAGCRQQAG